jgi:hypothetical protein
MTDKIDTKVNLCDTCKFHIPECMSEITVADVKYGNGKGNDNIYSCKKYEHGRNKG